MGQKDLRTNVILNGQTTSGFNQLADKITQLGQMISGVSGKVGEWEKESLETYKNYETYMLEAKGAMSATTESATELEHAYEDLNQKAQEWAGNTIFHTNDVAKAISEAAHAGWDYEKMLNGIPQAMALAQAGNTDLSSGLDMLIKTLNGTGTAFEDSQSFVDQWVMAANSSATTVSELGEAMEKMGATARFGDSNAELLTMLATLANTGTVGSAAGTLLRNSMIRLIAPTKNAREAMEGLGVEADEIAEAVGNDSEALAEVNDLLKQAGFNAYTSDGKLKPFLTTFKELYYATNEMTEEDRNKVLSSIFPTRTITGAMALLEAAANDYDGLLQKILDSEGYAEKVAGIQTSGLMGSEELFKSKWEEFSRKIGEILSEPVEGAYEVVGGFLDTLNQASPEVLSAIAGAATAIAAAGPGLMIAGMGIKLFSFLGPWGTAILASVVGIGALVGYFTELNKIAMEGNFGTMAVDMEAINEALSNVSTDVNTRLRDFKEYGAAAKQAAADYQAAGTKLTESLWSKMVTGATLTDDDKKQMEAKAGEFETAMQGYLETAFAEKIELAALIFSDNPETTDSDEDLAQNPVYASLISLLSTGYENAKEDAKAKSRELRKAITSAFEDGQLTEAEVRNIQEIMRQVNELVAGLSPSDVEREKLLNRSQTVSLKSMEEFGESVQAAKDAAFAETDEQLDDLLAWTRVLYKKAVENGTGFIDPNTMEWIEDPSQINIDELIKNTQEAYEQKRTAWGYEYDAILQKGWQNALATSGTGDLFSEAQGYLELAQQGFMTFAQAAQMILDSTSGDQGMLSNSLDLMIAKFGGLDKMAEMVSTYRGLGGTENIAMADWLEQMVVMREALGGKVSGGLYESAPEERKIAQNMATYLGDLLDNGIGAEDVQSYFDSLTEEQQASWQSMVDKLGEKLDLTALGMDVLDGFEHPENIEGMSGQLLSWLGAYYYNNRVIGNKARKDIVDEDFGWGEGDEDLLYGMAISQAEDAVQNQKKVLDDLGTQRAAIDQQLMELEGKAADESYFKSLTAEQQRFLHEQIDKLTEDQKQIELDTKDAEDKLQGLQTELEELEAHPPIEVKTETVLDTSAVDSWKPPAKYAYAYYSPVLGAKNNNGAEGDLDAQTYAEGGRATSPSIFGEAGAEWAIPEEHSARTAALLDAAREASGFTWGELIAARGGLNAEAGSGISVNIQSYAPVIHANDAAGVAEELAKDKARLGEIVKKAVTSALENMQMHESIEVYA